MSNRTFLVVGLGEFGISIVDELSRLNMEVIAVDKDEERVKKAAFLTPLAFITDATNELAINELDLGQVSDAIVAFGDNIQATILTTVLLKDLGVKHLIVRVDDDYYAPILKKLGADEIISPQKLAGRGLANRLTNYDFLDFYSLQGNFSVVKITVEIPFKTRTLTELDSRNNYAANIVLITRKNKTFAPRGEDTIEGGDILYVVGEKGSLDVLTSVLHNKAKK